MPYMIDTTGQLGDLGKIGRRLKKLGRKVEKVVRKPLKIAAGAALLYAGGKGIASLLSRPKAAPVEVAPPEPAPAPAPAPSVLQTIAQGAAQALPTVVQMAAARDAAAAVSAGVPPQVLPAMQYRDQVALPRGAYAPVRRGPGGELTAEFEPVEVTGRRPKRADIPWPWIAAGGGALVLVLLLTQRRS